MDAREASRLQLGLVSKYIFKQLIFFDLILLYEFQFPHSSKNSRFGLPYRE